MRRIVDEARKLVRVVELLDANRFVAFWRGQLYEARAVPDASDLSEEDDVVAHVLPSSTQLVAVRPQRDELWFSPGLNPSKRGELWVVASETATPQLAITFPDEFEYVTHLAWSQIDNNLYAFTYVSSTDIFIRAYRINRRARTAMLVNEIAYQSGVVEVDPVMDCAEFGGQLYTHHNGFFGGFSCNNPFGTFGSMVRRFDPTTGEWDEVFNYCRDGESSGFAGGIAVDPKRDLLVATDGWFVWTSATGDHGDWTWEGPHDFNEDPYACSPDNFSLITNRHIDDDVYITYNEPCAVDGTTRIVGRRTAPSTWVGELEDTLVNGASSSAQWYDKSGQPVALMVQRWAFFFTVFRTPIYRKEAGSDEWVVDWEGPPLGEEATALWSQGLCSFRGTMFSMLFKVVTGGVAGTALYRRVAENNYALVQEWPGYEPLSTFAWSGAMAVGPNPHRKCHEC